MSILNPTIFTQKNNHSLENEWLFLFMGLSGLEPPTSRLSGVRSNRLSYKPVCFHNIDILSHFLWYVKHFLEKTRLF